MMPADPHERSLRARRIFCATVLLCEAFVIVFAVLVAVKFSDTSDAVLWWGGGALAVTCVLLCGLLRHEWAYVVGTLVQVLLLLSAFVVPAMAFVGALFAGLWVTCFVLVRRIAASERFPDAPPDHR